MHPYLRIPRTHPPFIRHPKYWPYEVAFEAPPSEDNGAYLKLFLTPSKMDSMTCNPNAYAALKTSEHLQKGGRKWKGVSILELGTWLGIVI